MWSPRSQAWPSKSSCFVQEGEIDRATVREILGGHLKKEYQLDKQTARRTRVTEAH